MTAAPRLYPSQVCFVVEDVEASAADCVERFGWGPFQDFTARVDYAEYRGWQGPKVTDVALGMAGRVQVELIHVHEGRDAVAAYQEKYRIGFQHLGIGCRDRDAAVRYLEANGGGLNDQTEYAGIRIAFVDTPTGDAMFELLQPIRGESGKGPELAKRAESTRSDVLALDRATIVTDDMEVALRFHAAAFGWENRIPERQTLRYGSATTSVRRVLGTAGALQLELIEPRGEGEDPYSAHLRRGGHGLVHTGGVGTRDFVQSASLECEWVETGEAFRLHDWAGGPCALQVRTVAFLPADVEVTV